MSDDKVVKKNQNSDRRIKDMMCSISDTLLNLHGDYLTKLNAAYKQQDQDALNRIFSKIGVELMEIRKSRNISSLTRLDKTPEAMRNRKMIDLEIEFSDNLGLFYLASLFQYQPEMDKRFHKMVQNRKDKRESTNDWYYTERNKKTWDNLEIHLRRVQRERQLEATAELSDLMRLYDIAKFVGHQKGVTLISNRVQEITSSLADSNSSFSKDTTTFVKK